MPDPHQPVPFDVALRGYDRDQVDSHLASIESEFSSAVAERDRLAERVKQLETRVEELHLEDGEDSSERSASPLTGFGARIERIMRTAEEEAAAVREEVEAEIERERSASAKRVSTIQQAAEKDAVAHRRKVEQEAAQLLDKARQDAARVRADSDAQASATREEASGHLEAVRAKAAQAAADFETALAKRRHKAEADHISRTKTAERELAETVARTDQLRAETEKMRADAERRSQEMLQAAQRESGELVTEARAQADRTRRESERELATLSKRRDAITDQLRNVREMLSTLTGGAVSSPDPEPAEDEEVPAPRASGDRAAAEARRSWAVLPGGSAPAARLSRVPSWSRPSRRRAVGARGLSDRVRAGRRRPRRCRGRTASRSRRTRRR